MRSHGGTTSQYAGKADLTPDEQAGFLVQEGSLAPVFDGLGASLDTALKANEGVKTELAASPFLPAEAITRLLDRLNPLRTIGKPMT